MEDLPDGFSERLAKLFAQQNQWRGATLGALLKNEFPGLDFKPHGGLSKLVLKTLAGSSYSSERDVLFLGTLSETTPDSQPSQWLAYTSPRLGYELVVTATGDLAVAKRGHPSPGNQPLGHLSDDDYAEAAKSFVERAPEGARDALRAAATTYSYTTWSEAIKTANLLNPWMAYRSDWIKTRLLHDLTRLGVEKQGLVERVLASKGTQPKVNALTLAPTRTAVLAGSSGLRAKVVDVVGKMSDTELDALWLPVRALREARLL